MSKLFPDEIGEFIARNIKGIGNVELSEKVNNTFGTQYTPGQVRGYKQRNKLSSGLDGRFGKGHTPVNKGVKGKCAKGCEKGWFKKGRESLNLRELGSERIDSKDGYTLVKVAEPNKWRLKQHLIWEEHKGSILEGHKIIFLDGDKTNFDISNLAMVSDREHLIMNKNNLRYEDARLTETGILIAKVSSNKSQRKRSKQSK